MYTVGETTGDHRFAFEQADGVRPFDLAVDQMFGSSPKTYMIDKTVERKYDVVTYDATQLDEYVERVLQLEAVACKDWLTNKVDRCVTGRVARQQCQGELQLPLSDCGAVTLDYRGNKGIATAIGHAPQAALANPEAGSVLAVSESLTNLVWAPLAEGLDSVSLSANWMWPCRAQEGEDARLYKAVKAAHPEIEIISSAGPVAEGALPAYAWRVVRAKYPDTIVDEHYYMSGDWFLNNMHRYDRYPRTTKVFLGEFAAHEATQPNGRRPNNLYSALCEAAYMTGIERNSDLVRMACYAPLLARDGMFQWTPDLIWFNARDVLLTPNYYVQQMFAATVGDHVVESTLEGENLYHVVTRTEDKLYVKVVSLLSLIHI